MGLVLYSALITLVGLICQADMNDVLALVLNFFSLSRHDFLGFSFALAGGETSLIIRPQ